MGTPVFQVPFPGRPGIWGPTLGPVSACHGSPLVSLSLRLAPGTPCASPTSSRGPLGPGLQRGKPARPVTRARAEGRTCVRCGEGIPGPCRELRPQRAREELRGPRLLPPHPGRRKPDQRGERTASPPEAAPPAARGHAPRGPAPPHSAWAGLRASRAPRPAPMEQLLRAELRTATLRAFGSPGAGCISEGRAYDTDAGPVFVKVNRRTQVLARAQAGALRGSAERGEAAGSGAGAFPGAGPGEGAVSFGPWEVAPAGWARIKRSVRVCVCTIRDLPLASVRSAQGFGDGFNFSIQQASGEVRLGVPGSTLGRPSQPTVLLAVGKKQRHGWAPAREGPHGPGQRSPSHRPCLCLDLISISC